MMKKLFINSSISIVILAIVVGCTSTSNKRGEKTSRVEELPFFSEATFSPQWIDPEAVPEDFHQIPSFSLTNQRNEVITEKDLNGKVTVVDFFFTTCPGICPKMTSNMLLVQDAFMKDSEVLILSHSVTPEYDSVEILNEYADAKGVTSENWHLLTGERSVIYDLGRNRYFVEEDLGLEKDPEDFIHTENFVLIDQERRIRGIYNGLNKSSIAQLIADMKTLLKDS